MWYHLFICTFLHLALLTQKFPQGNHSKSSGVALSFFLMVAQYFMVWVYHYLLNHFPIDKEFTFFPNSWPLQTMLQ